MAMKLYYHPASTTSRTIMMFAAEEAPDIELSLVDIFSGEHIKPEYVAINPSQMVPVLEDGDFRLTECSAILKYLAEKLGSPSYPKDLRERARVNEMMDWINSNLYRDLAYGVVYPQAFPGHKRRSEEAQAATLAWGAEKAKAWLKILDERLIGPDKAYLCGNRLTIADYLGAEMIGAGELVGCTFADYPNVRRWLGNMKQLKSWPSVHAAIDGFAASIKRPDYVAL
jgi:glutathione S-transferase